MHAFPQSLLLKSIRFKGCALIRPEPKPAWIARAAIPLLALLFLTDLAAADMLAPAGKSQEVPKVKVDGKEYFEVGFEKLSAFDYKVIDLGTGASAAEIEVAKKRNQIPEDIKSFDNKPISLTGYMQPLLIPNRRALRGRLPRFSVQNGVRQVSWSAVKQR